MGKEVGCNPKGYTILKNDILENLDLNIQEQSLLIAIISYYNKEKGYAYPNYEQLKLRSKIKDNRTLNKNINSLIEKKFIKKETLKGIGCKYYITLHSGELHHVENYTASKNTLTPSGKLHYDLVENYTTTNTNTNTITNTNIYTLSEDEDSISYFERINKEIDNLENEINNNYDKELIQKEKDKLISKSLIGLPLLKELKKVLENHNKKIKKEQSNKDIEDIWRLYPRKEGKQKSIKNIPKILKKHSKEELIRCIERYVKETEGTDKKFILMGSTFFNGRYADYLDSNYNDIKPKEVNRNIDYVDEIMKEMYEKGEF